MKLKLGHRQTGAGAIPEDWLNPELQEVTQDDSPIRYGIVQVGPFTGNGVPVLAIKNLGLDLSNNVHRASINVERRYARSRIQSNDVLISIKGTTGRVGIVPNDFRGNISRDLARIRPRKGVAPNFLYQVLQSDLVQRRLSTAVVGTTRRELSIAALRKIQIPLPPSELEQGVIARTLSDADSYIESLEQLLVKKRHLRKGVMQGLLTGKRRLTGFSKVWQQKRIAEIASPSSEKNSAGDRLPVLTCSKHLGFVDSLTYFKNQVFSKNTSGYKIIRRGQLGYPANHIEEGSIGLQDLHDVALVSPIYVVFSVSPEVNAYFLHRLLKLDCYRQKFETATSASVDRRGSLRWPAFSELTVRLPEIEEQSAIVAILSDMEVEIGALEARLAKVRNLKQGLMQEVLTGRTRLI